MLMILLVVLLSVFLGFSPRHHPEIWVAVSSTVLSAQPLWLPPLAQAVKPRLASYNHQGLAENRVRTPLFVGFKQNHDLLGRLHTLLRDGLRLLLTHPHARLHHGRCVRGPYLRCLTHDPQLQD